MTTGKEILVRKASGDLVPFKMEKLKRSLQRSGANKAVIEEIADEVEAMLVEGITTKKIYHEAYRLLKKMHKPTAARYKLKKAIMELGPSGYPFENFVGEMLKRQGYDTQVGVMVKGNCVTHEIDVVAEKEGEHFMIECKYHNKNGMRTDVKVPLYIQSRFIDVRESWQQLPGHNVKFHQGWVVTNTQFSDDAIQYGKCIGLNLVSWNYPQNNGIKDLIDRLKLYPVTCLSTITKAEKKRLLDKNIVICSELCQQPEVLRSIGISSNRMKNIIQECTNISNGEF